VASGVLVDANVFFSRTTRDWLFLLRNQTRGMFTVHATVDVVAEAVYSLRREFPNAPGRLTRRAHQLILDNLDELVEDFTVDEDWPGKDPDDAHVHAAAIACRATILLSGDKGFSGVPDDIDVLLPYEVHTTDSFFTLIDDSAPDDVRAVALEQHAYWSGRREGWQASDLAAKLAAAGCPVFSERVLRHLEGID